MGRALVFGKLLRTSGRRFGPIRSTLSALPTAGAVLAEHGVKSGRLPGEVGGPTTAWIGSARRGCGS